MSLTHSQRTARAVRAILPLYLFSAAAQAVTPFAVRDSIEMTVLAQPDANQVEYGGTEVDFSPDFTQFFIVTRRGDLTRGCNDYALLIYQTAAVLKSLGDSTLPPPAQTICFCTASNRAGISAVKWSASGMALTFLGTQMHEPTQMFSADLASGKIRQISHHSTSVLSYDINASGRYIYMAEAPLDWSKRRAHGYVVGTEPFLDVVMRGASSLFTPAAFYIAQQDDSRIIAVAEPPYNTFGSSFGLWLSPNGNWAVGLKSVPRPPLQWMRGYQPIAAESRARGEGYDALSSGRGTADFYQSTEDFIGVHPENFQYVLINMATGASEPILDAPSGYPFGGLALGAFWHDDGKTLILANTFLPLTGVSAAERARRAAGPVIVSVNLYTRRYERITDIPMTRDVGGYLFGALTKIRRDDRGKLWMTTTQRQSQKTEVLSKVGGAWIKAAPRAAAAPPLRVQVVQNLNRAPELEAADSRARRAKVITDLNPSFRERTMGEVQAVSWIDKAGREWHGGLIKPINFVPGQRYPLLIATHGFKPQQFLVDGPDGWPSGYATRALANRGVAVLLVDDTWVVPISEPQHYEIVMNAYRSAVDKFVAEGWVDARRIGMQGFSRTGYNVQYAITFAGIPLAAALVADASEASVWNLILWYGMFSPGMFEQERIIGTRFWGKDNIAQWMQRDPLFHLDRMHTPLLIQSYMTDFPWFDTFALLRRHHRPVEFMSFPNATHILFQPWQRLTAQESTLDWFDFWLNGHEDPSSAKAEQYIRWRKLRGLHVAN
jgi:dipeptidyl aminopeptidase/acylaminoacyl peptidase